MPDILMLRLEGYLQAWGERGRARTRDTALLPTKSGVIGLLCAAQGVNGDQDARSLTLGLTMGVKIEKPGTVIMDYQTVTSGTLMAQGGIKGGRNPETFVSQRAYLCGAAFTVALMGERRLVDRLVSALLNPVWPLYLGRMCCIPSSPILIGTRQSPSLATALGEDGPVEIESEPYSNGIVRFDQIVSLNYRVFEPRFVQRKGFDNVHEPTKRD